jgi:biofilm PGA synthesis N-glycosyltransferase PgaC
VFYDPRGRRQRWVVATIVLLVLAAGLLALVITPRVLAPTWPALRNASVSYPERLLSRSPEQDMPVLSADGGFVFQRIALVQRTKSRVLLKDPFSDKVFREAREDEVEQIGDSPYVLDTYGAPADHQIMLTFDDGPDPRYTAEILDVLSSEHVPATFFPIGRNIDQFPELVDREVREGHMVGNHTMNHVDFYANDATRNRFELIGTDRLVRAVAGYQTRLFRIPEGDPYDNPRAVLQAQQLGYLHVDYDLDTLDWSYPPGERVPVPDLDGKGHVVLMHDGGGDRSQTAEMLRELIRQAKAQGYEFTTLAPLLDTASTPRTRIPPDTADYATLVAASSVLVAPKNVGTWLFWTGIISLTAMSLLYVVLALMEWSRQRKEWAAPRAPQRLPLVSVVLPLFNEERVVTKTLDALRASDYPNLEVIAVDDGSTDGTLALVREYAQRWRRLRVLTQENGGKSRASNNGIAHARGEVVVTLDGDTVFEPRTIRMLARHFVADDGGKPVGAVAGLVKVGNRRNLLTAWQSLEYISGICVTRMAEGFVGAISIAPGACAAWRRDALLRVGGYSHDTQAEDADLTLSMQAQGYAVVQENEAVAWTEAPTRLHALAKQRLRWTYGNIQALYKHRSMLFRPRYGALGMVTLPYALMSVLVPLVFMPFVVFVAVASLLGGNWESVALFAAAVALLHLIISAVAIGLVHERPWHLLLVPVYRLIYEPLRAYVLYGSLVRIVRGRIVGWYRPERTGTVMALVPTKVPETV